MPSTHADQRRDRVRRSALWAAYGDALGFITEGVDAGGVRRRAGADTVEQTVPWKRRVGGKMGTVANLPAGCLSDDTQLRLATSRSIRGPGEFDVETFAKIELTVWPSYALGAGVGSQHAAANLRRRNVTWDTNFFSDKRSDYMKGGGNGAAMRIQPHVWAAPADGDPRLLIATVVRNAVTTHGHLRGILGAVFHALCLRHALEAEEPPGPPVWSEIADELLEVAEIVREDSALSELWRGQWEMRSPEPFSEATARVAAEVREDLARCRRLDPSNPNAAYADAVAALETRQADQRGSGTKTAVLAAVLSWLFDSDVNEVVKVAANCLHTDTDTIATMAGAISGALAEHEPEGPLCDRDYIAQEANRMAAMAAGGSAPAFRYPSLVAWTPPHSASDCIGMGEEGITLAALGPGWLDRPEYKGGGRYPAVWQWFDLWFGQRVLVKRKPRPEKLPSSQSMGATPQYLRTAPLLSAPPPQGEELPRSPRQESFEDLGKPANVHLVEDSSPREPTIHELTRQAIASGFDPELMGSTLRSLIDRDDGIEASIAYTSILAKAWISRRGASG